MKKNSFFPIRPIFAGFTLRAACALALLAVAPARAATYTWLNSGSDFATGANWSPLGPPADVSVDLAQFTTLGTFSGAAVGPVVNSAVNSRLWFGNTASGGGYTLSGTGSVTGGSSSASGLITRGIGNTTISLGDGATTSLALTGSNIASAIDVGYGSTLTLGGNTIATADIATIHGTLVLDNSAGNPNSGSSQRLTISNSNFFLSGGTTEFKSASGGSSFVLSGLSCQAGSDTVRVNQTSATGLLAVTFGSGFVSTSSSLNFINAGAGTLGGGGTNDPTLKFTTAFSNMNGVINTGSSFGKWIVNGSDFAGYDATNGVFAITATAVSGTLASATTQNSVLSSDASITANDTVTYNTLKIAPTAAGQSLAMGDNSTLTAGLSSQQSLLLAGSTSYAITGTGTRLLTGTTADTIWVTDPAAVLSVTASVGPATGGSSTAVISKTGDGFLWLNGAANQVSYSSTSPTFAILAGVLRVSSTTFDLTTTHAPKVAFRGGVLEYDVSGTAFVFARTLGTNIAGQVNWRGNSGSSSDTGSGGFSAYAGTSNSGAGNGNALTVNIGGSSAALTWGTTPYFVGDGEALKFGSTLSNSTVIWKNPLALDGGSAGDAAIRQIDVTKGIGNAADKTQLTGVISGSSTTDLVKTGTGTLELTKANTYAGNTLVSAGTLAVNNTTGSGTGTGTVSIASGASLIGSFTISGNTQVDGTLSPGTNGIGTANFAGNLTLSATSTTTLELASAASYDRIGVDGTLSLLAGPMSIATRNGYTAHLGDSFHLLSWGALVVNGFDVTTNLDLSNAALDPGLSWDTSNFLTTGILVAIPEPAATPAAIANPPPTQTRPLTRNPLPRPSC